MATYFKYAERNASTDVNWAEIGKNLTDTLAEQNRLREEKKAQIDDESRKYGEILSNAPTGENRDVNEWALKFADDAQQARLLQDRLLKSGQLKLKDYTIMRQNLTDGTKNAFSLIDEYQKEYKDKMERAKNGENQALEEFYMAQAEGLANFKNTNLYINPTNYQISVGKMYQGEDGVSRMSENPNDFVTVNDLRNRIKQKFDYFDYDKATTQWVNGLGKYSLAVMKAGGWSIITDPLQREKIKDPAKKQVVNQLMESMDNELKSYIFANPYNGTSLLTEDIGTIDGKAVSFTFDEAEAKKNKNLVLLKQDPNNPNGPAIPEFSKEQQDIMLDFMKTQAIVKLEHTETYQQKTAQWMPEYMLDRGDKKKVEENAVNTWNSLFLATNQAERNSAIQALLSMERNINNGLLDIIFNDDDTVTFKYENEKRNKTMSYKDVNLQQWANMGNEVTGIDNVKETLIRSGGGDPKAKMKDAEGLHGLKAHREGGKTVKEDPIGAYNNMIDSELKTPEKDKAPEGILFDPNNDESAVVANLQSKYGAYGFEFVGTGTLNDYVTVYPLDSSGKKIVSRRIEIPVNNAEGSLDSPKLLRDFIKRNTTDAKKIEAAQSGVTGKGVMSQY